MRIGLENAAHGEFALVLVADAHGLADRLGEGGGVGERVAGERLGDGFGAGFVGIFVERGFEFFRAGFCQPVGGGEAAARVHPHVERAGGFVAEAARGIVELHRGATEIGENEVDLSSPRSARTLAMPA